MDVKSIFFPESTQVDVKANPESKISEIKELLSNFYFRHKLLIKISTFVLYYFIGYLVLNYYEGWDAIQW